VSTINLQHHLPLHIIIIIIIITILAYLPVVREERRMSAALLLSEYVHLSLELLVRLHRVRRCQHLPTTHILSLQSSTGMVLMGVCDHGGIRMGRISRWIMWHIAVMVIRRD